MRRRLLIGVLLSCLLPLWHAQAEEAIDNAAASITSSVATLWHTQADESINNAAVSIIASVAGKNDFHAHMARKLAAIAIHERRDRDREDAREFIDMARQHVTQARVQQKQESP